MGTIQDTQPWTTRRLLNWMTEAFTKKQLDSPRLSAELLLSHVIGCDRMRLYMEADRPASELERGTLRDLVGRALKNEPIDYLVGERWFFGLPFHVNKDVLVPRPSTETIVEQVLHHARAEPGFGGKTGEGVRIADIGTGSGCIVVSLLKNMPKAMAIATDISGAALEMARKNAARHGVSERVEFLAGDLLAPLADHPAGPGGGGEFHYIVSNPPYIPDGEWDEVPANVRDYEPHGALRAGADGLEFLRRLVADAPGMVRPGGLLVLECAASTAARVRDLAAAHPMLEGARVVTDFEGLPRVVVAGKQKT